VGGTGVGVGGADYRLQVVVEQTYRIEPGVHIGDIGVGVGAAVGALVDMGVGGTGVGVDGIEVGVGEAGGGGWQAALV